MYIFPFKHYFVSINPILIFVKENEYICTSSVSNFNYKRKDESSKKKQKQKLSKVRYKPYKNKNQCECIKVESNQTNRKFKVQIQTTKLNNHFKPMLLSQRRPLASSSIFACSVVLLASSSAQYLRERRIKIVNDL